MWYTNIIKIINYFIIILKFLFFPIKTIQNILKTNENFITNNSKNNSDELKIISTGIFLPKKYVTNKDLIKIINNEDLIIRNEKNLPLEEFITKYYGVSGRYFSSDYETHSQMAFGAALNALENSNLNFTDIDCIIYASPGMDKLIPDTSVYIHEKLSKHHKNNKNINHINNINHIDHNPPSFTVHSTCLSSLHALNIANSFIKSKIYNTIMIISSEKTTTVVNACDPKTCTILGDMATAIIVGKHTCVHYNKYDNVTEKIYDIPSKVFLSKFKTYSENLCDNMTVDFGTINVLERRANKSFHDIDDFIFKIKNNKELINVIPTIFSDFVSDVIFTDYDHVVIHQSSKIFVDNAKAIFGEKLVETFDTVGNCGSCSIPFNLHKLLTSGHLRRGDKIILVGIGAGLGTGLIGLIY